MKIAKTWQLLEALQVRMIVLSRTDSMTQVRKQVQLAAREYFLQKAKRDLYHSEV